MFLRFNTADLDRIPRSLRNVEAKRPKAKWPKQNSLHMTPIHGETDILRRLRNVEARTQMAKSQKPNGHKNNLCMTPLHGETDILRRLRNIKARTQMTKSQNTNGQKAKHKWTEQNSLHMTPIDVSPLQSGSYTPKLSLYLYYVPLIN